MYEEHKMETVFFDRLDVFAGLGFASDADENGEGSGRNSYGGDSPSDM